MIRTLLLLVSLLTVAATGLGDEIPPTEVMGMLGSRELVGQVSFIAGSDQLDQSARKELDRIAGALVDSAKGNKLVRVEGFGSEQEGTNQAVGLAMARAKAVETYLRESKRLMTEIYLIGHGPERTSQVAPRVEVAVYDMLLPVSDAPVDNIIRKW